MRNVLRWLWVAVASAALCLQAAGRTIEVTSPADAGPGSLRQAVAEAGTGDTIIFSAGITRVELTGGEILIVRDLQILGPEAQGPEGQLVIDANGTSRVFHVAGPAGGVLPRVLLSDLALTGGLARGENGGGLLNEGALRLIRCSVYGNSARPGPGGGGNGGGGNGGGVSNAGTLSVEASTIYGNRAFAGVPDSGNGGGIHNGWAGRAPVVPQLTLLNATVSGNEAGAPPAEGAGAGRPLGFLAAVEEKTGMGGGIFADIAPAGGAWGVDAFPGWIEVEHSTITANRAWTGGGVTNYLFSENGESTIGEVAGGALLLRGSILSGNLATAPDGVSDLQGDGLPFGCVLGSHLGNLGGSGNITSLDPGLMSLADNGGPTLTHAPKSWSPAVNAGPKDTEPATDQTGAPRVVAGRADSGSVEAAAPPVALGNGASASYSDRDGDPVSIVLSGPGQGYATVANGADAVDIVLTGTRGSTELQIETSGQTTIRTIDVTGDLKAILAPGADLLGSISVTGGLGALTLRDVVGPAGITFGAAPGKGAKLRFRNVRDLALITEGKIKVLTAAEWEGTADGAHDVVRAERIGAITIAGWARKLRIESAGDIDRVEVGGFRQSYAFAGVSQGLIGLADPRTDFVGTARIREFVVTGAVSDEEGDQFIDGVLSARVIGKALLGPVADEGPVHGLSAGAIHHLRFRVGGQEFNRRDLRSAGDSLRNGSFTASLDSTADLGFTFGSTDDTRSDLTLPGIAINHLGLMFQYAAQDHCRFLLMPGDFATGYMVLCSNETICAAWDPDGTKSVLLSDLQYTELLTLAAKYGYFMGKNLFPTRGNHECYLQGDATRTQWTKYVGKDLPQNGPSQGMGPDQNPEMDERGFTYSFKFGNSLFLGIDEYATLHDKDNGLAPAPATVVPSVFCNGWLSEQIAAFKSDPSLAHCFAFGHSPLYEVKMNTSMDATASTRAGRDAFVQNVSGAAEIYFCGHEHFYDHTLIADTTLPGGAGIDGLHQVLVGTGGAEIDKVTQDDCTYSASYIRDPSRQYYHNPEVPTSGTPRGYIGYNLVTVSGPDVSFLWKAWAVHNPCSLLPCGLCPSCTVDSQSMVTNSWSYTVNKQ